MMKKSDGIKKLDFFFARSTIIKEGFLLMLAGYKAGRGKGSKERKEGN
jgi:hypothetical protein